MSPRISEALLEGVDAVVPLAAVSNDPMGNKFERVTEDVNYRASVDVGRKARKAGVSHFVFASSCSVYGFAPGAPRKESDELNPQTAYARSKINTEKALAEIRDNNMIVTSLRFATACGMSDRLRLDLVLNDFVGCALALGEISVLSDGSPWRPLIDVRDNGPRDRVGNNARSERRRRFSCPKCGLGRGMHFHQRPYAEVKVVRLHPRRGYVIIDVRKKSPTFGKFYSAELADENGAAMYVPIGFAHGYQALTNSATVHYTVSAFYALSTKMVSAILTLGRRCVIEGRETPVSGSVARF
jgi:hypothetical protein